MRTFSPLPPFSFTLLTTLAACGGGDLTLPADGSPASLRAMSGSGQQGTVGTQLRIRWSFVSLTVSLGRCLGLRWISASRATAAVTATVTTDCNALHCCQS